MNGGSRSTTRWESALTRHLQSWRNTAPCAAFDWRIHRECGMCADDHLLAIADSARGWPHWMRHGFRERMLEFRAHEFECVLEEPFDGETSLADHYRELNGDGVLGDNTNAQQGAVQVVDRHMASFDRWLSARVHDLDFWEQSVIQRVDPPGSPGYSLHIVTARWIDGLSTWEPGNAETPTECCDMCMNFPMVQAAGLPGWVPHSVTHDYASRILTLMSRFSGYDWRSGMSLELETSYWSDEDRELLEESRRRETLEFEEAFFLEMRELSRQIGAAVMRFLRPGKGPDTFA